MAAGNSIGISTPSNFYAVMSIECEHSPTGKHYPITDVVEVIIKGKKVAKLVVCCYYCGKIL